jgi:hypothetical protein
LGVPLHWKKLRIRDWDFLINKVAVKLDHWKGKLLSLGGRLTLIKSILNAISIYWLTIFRISAKIRKILDQLCRRFLWFGENTIRKKYCLVRWKVLCTSFEQGGLGILNLKTMNKALLVKWLWRFHNIQEKYLWKTIIENRYNNSRTTNNMSTFWKEVNKEKDIFITSISKKIGNGSKTLFWKDRWLNDCSLNIQYPFLFEISMEPNITVAQVIGYNRYYLSFTRSLTDTLRKQLMELYTKLSTISLNTQEDSYIWR